MVPRRLLPMAFALAGCVTYASVEPATVAPARVLRFDLTPLGSAELAPVLGPGLSAVDAMVEAQRGDTLILRMRATLGESRLPVPWRDEAVRVPWRAVAAVKERRLDRTRSWLLAGTLLGGAVAVAAATDMTGFSSSPRGGGSSGPK